MVAERMCMAGLSTPGRRGCSRLRRGCNENPFANPAMDSLVDGSALLGGGQTRTTNRARTPARDAQPAAAVTSQLLPGHHIILSDSEIDELRRDVKQQRR